MEPSRSARLSLPSPACVRGQGVRARHNETIARFSLLSPACRRGQRRGAPRASQSNEVVLRTGGHAPDHVKPTNSRAVYPPRPLNGSAWDRPRLPSRLGRGSRRAAPDPTAPPRVRTSSGIGSCTAERAAGNGRWRVSRAPRASRLDNGCRFRAPGCRGNRTLARATHGMRLAKVY
jgi:hypothetical protein